MIIYFRTSGGKLHGWGNIIRLTTIIKFFNKKKIKTILFFEGDDKIENFLIKNKIKYFRLKNNISASEEESFYKKFYKPDIFFLEMIKPNLKRQSILKKYSKMLVVLDDVLKHKYCADLVISMQKKNNIKKSIFLNKNLKFFNDYNLFPYRKDIIKLSKKRKIINKEIKEILVILGGGAYDTYFLKIAKALKKTSFNPKVKMILGHSNFDRLKSKIKKINPKIKLLGGQNYLSQYIQSADLAIVSGGYTKLEVAVTFTPLLIVCTQWHQIDLARSFNKYFGSPYLGQMSQISIKQIIKLIESVKPKTKRLKMSRTFREKLNHKGIEKLYSIVIKRFYEKK